MPLEAIWDPPVPMARCRTPPRLRGSGKERLAGVDSSHLLHRGNQRRRSRIYRDEVSALQILSRLPGGQLSPQRH